jgi:hypothetical protein
MGTTSSFDSKDKYISGVMYSKEQDVVGYYTSDSDKNDYMKAYHKKLDSNGNILAPAFVDPDSSFKFPAGWFLSGIFTSRVPLTYEKNEVSDPNITSLKKIEYHITDGNTIMIGGTHLQNALAVSNDENTTGQFTCGTDYINKIYQDTPLLSTSVYTGVCIAGDVSAMPIPLVPVMVPVPIMVPETPMAPVYDMVPETPVFIYNPGPTGPIGIRGQPGWMGRTGQSGSRGAIGAQGDIGVRGAIGPTGMLGKAGLIGGVGKVGQQGIPGVIGDRGQSGSIGQIGSTGIMGSQGPKGYQGQQGQQGIPGLVGSLGDQGIPGLKFGEKKYKYQLHTTTVLTIMVLIYILLWVSSIGAMIGITGKAPTSIGGALHTITGGMINLQ